VKKFFWHFFKTKDATLKAQALKELAWIYNFWESLAPYAYARQEDLTIILPPNLVYKTNQTGIQLIQWIGLGKKLDAIPHLTLEKIKDIHQFFTALRNAYLEIPQHLESVPYNFDFTTLPVLGELAVTYACNHKCKFCYAGCTTENPKANLKELDTQGLKNIIALFKTQAKIPFFSFTGGEPLLRPDLEELAAYATQLGLRINLITNGTLATPKRALSLYQAGFRTAQVSLESPQEEEHDRLTGIKGSFSKALKGIQALQQAGIKVQTNTTLTALNHHSLLELPAFLVSLGINRMSLNLFIPVGTGQEWFQDLYLSYSKVGEIVDKIRAQALSLNMEFFWYAPTPLCIYNPLAKGLGNKSCAACDGLISVSPLGDLMPCSSWPHPVGNLLQEGFENVWFSKKSLWFKQKQYAPKECQSCNAFNACQAACPLYFDAVGYDEVKPFWKSA